MSHGLRAASVLAFCLASSLAARERLLLTGVVMDMTGGSVAGAGLAAIDENTGLRFAASSGPDGVYALALPAGSYKVTARKPGFCTVAKLNVNVQSGAPARADFTLPVGNFRETITIDDAPDRTNTVDASVGGIAGRQWVETLPLNGRGLLSLIDLAPGVLATPASGGEAGQFTVNGQRPNTNYFTVDGVSANNALAGGIGPAQFAGGTLPSMTAFGGAQNVVSLEALEEVRIQTSTFAPEFGRMPGGHIALTTRSGTDQLHGSLFYAFRHETLNANDWIANSLGLGKAPSRMNHGGGSIGGPLRSGRTHYFAAAEAMRIVPSATWSMLTPSLRARQSAPEPLRPLLNAFPLPTGPETSAGVAEAAAQTVRPAQSQAYTLRGDHVLSPRISLFGVYHQAPSSADFGFFQVDHSAFTSRRLTFGSIAVINSSVVNEIRAGFSRTGVHSQAVLNGSGGAVPPDLRRYVPDTIGADSALYALSIGGIGQFATGDAGRNRQRQGSISDTVSARMGSHALRIGVEYQRLSPERLSAAARAGISYNSLADLLNGEAPVLSRTLSEAAVSNIETFSAFFQDTWRPRSRLSITSGLRWELAPPPSYTPLSSGLSAAFPPEREPVPPALGTGLANTGGTFPANMPSDGSRPVETLSPFPIWRTRYSRIAPRAGAAYMLTSRSVLRAGWGLFYDTAFSAALDPINGYAFNRRQLASGGASELAFVTVGGWGAATGLELPKTWQWNAAWETDFGSIGTITASYVGARGEGLLRREGTLLFRTMTGNISNVNILGSAWATNNGQSSYHGLQLHYRRQWQGGLRANATYTLSRSMDNGSWDSGQYLVMPEAGITAGSERAPSSFDIGHSATVAASYLVSQGAIRPFRGWTVDSMIRARTGFPMDVRTAENLLGLGFDNLTRPDLVAGQPVWLADPNVPGGRRLNPLAFATPSGLQGNLGRNAIRGFGMMQADLALWRRFPVSETAAVEFRAEVFNVLNRASAGDPIPFLRDARFGRAASMLNLMMGSGAPHSGLTPAFQSGGPRTLQLQLRFRF